MSEEMKKVIVTVQAWKELQEIRNELDETESSILERVIHDEWEAMELGPQK